MSSTDVGELGGDGNGRGTLSRGLRVVWKGARQEPGAFGAAVVGSAVYGAGTAAGGWILGRLTDDVLEPAFKAGRISGHDLGVVGGVLAAVAVLTAVGVVVRRAAAGVTMFRLQARYRRAVTRQFLRLPLAWHHRHPAGQLLSNANADVEAIWQVMAPLPMALGVIVMLVVAVVAMVLADPVLAAVGLLVLPSVLVANTFYQRRMSPAVMAAQRLRAEVSAVAHESFEAAAVVKSLGREAAETRRFARSADGLRSANVEAGRLRAMFDPVIEAVPTLGTLAVLLIGAWRVSTGAADTGDLVQVAYLLGLVAFPLRATGWVLGELPRTVVGWERVTAVLDAEGEMPYGGREIPGTGPVRLQAHELDYSHVGEDGEDLPALHRIDLDVRPGTTVALVGPTGSGKSTLAALLVRLVDPTHGRVEVDGVDVRELRAGALAEVVAMVPQQTFVFDDTVRGNLTLEDAVLAGSARFTDEQVWQALRVARAADFVAALPDGLDTMVGERGASLSGGQRQRIALARALVRRPRLLLLDDATSAIDPRVEAEILHGLRESADADPATVIVVASRRATIDLADEVVYLEAGAVGDRGRHEDLLERSPGYRALVTAYDLALDDVPDDADETAGFEEEFDELEDEGAVSR